MRVKNKRGRRGNCSRQNQTRNKLHPKTTYKYWSLWSPHQMSDLVCWGEAMSVCMWVWVCVMWSVSAPGNITSYRGGLNWGKAKQSSLWKNAEVQSAGLQPAWLSSRLYRPELLTLCESKCGLMITPAERNVLEAPKAQIYVLSPSCFFKIQETRQTIHQKLSVCPYKTTNTYYKLIHRHRSIRLGNNMGLIYGHILL